MARQTYESFLKTIQRGDTRILFAIDLDDPMGQNYTGVPLLTTRAKSMGQALNEAVLYVLGESLVSAPTYIGMIGDDNRFRSPGWDVAIHDALDKMGGGIAYGNDLWHHDALPTAWFVSASIVQALGWMAMPTLTHLYMDNTWRTIGIGIDHYCYIPEAIIEHLHPTYGKGQWDDSYRKTNSPEMYEHDRLAFEEWLREQAPVAIEVARAAL